MNNKQRLAFDELRKLQEQEMDALLRQYAIDNGCPQVGDVLKVHGINRWVKVKCFSPTFVRTAAIPASAVTLISKEFPSCSKAFIKEIDACPLTDIIL